MQIALGRVRRKTSPTRVGFTINVQDLLGSNLGYLLRCRGDSHAMFAATAPWDINRLKRKSHRRGA